jgi:twitching motility two-component system response regulator PilH
MNTFKKVLVIDDAELDRVTMQKILEKNGYTVITAVNAIEGIEKAIAEQPDLIMMDVVMPNKSGFEATRELQGDPRTKHIPVIICSTKSLKTDHMWGMKQGAAGYIVKPIKEPAVISAIQVVQAK